MNRTRTPPCTPDEKERGHAPGILYAQPNPMPSTFGNRQKILRESVDSASEHKE